MAESMDVSHEQVQLYDCIGFLITFNTFK